MYEAFIKQALLKNIKGSPMQSSEISVPEVKANLFKDSQNLTSDLHKLRALTCLLS
jgi:hypothetical protein